MTIKSDFEGNRLSQSGIGAQAKKLDRHEPVLEGKLPAMELD